VPVDTLPHLVRAFLEEDPDALTSEMIGYMRVHAATLGTPKAAFIVLDNVARSGHVQALERLATAFQQYLHVPPGTAMHESLLLGFAAAGCKEKVDEVIAQMRAKGLKVTARAFLLIIKGYLRNGLLDAALLHVDEMRMQGFHLPCLAVVEIFRAAQGAGRSEELLDKVLGMLKLSQDASTILLEDCLARQDRALAERIRAMASDSGLKLPQAASEALLRLYVISGDLRALDVLDEMQRFGSFYFSERFCVGILTRCADAKFLRMAEELVRRARAAEGKLTVTTYSALMKVYAHCGLYTKACGLYEQVLADGLQPDSIMYSCLLKFANECGRLDLARELSQKVNASDVQHCMLLMRTAGAEGKLDKAFEHLKTLREAGGKPDIASYNCLIDVCVNAGDMKRAGIVFDDMRSTGRVDKISYNTMVKGYCAFHDAHAAKKMLKEMEAAGFSPNDITFNSLINMAGSSGNMSDAWGYLRDMQERGIVLDKYTICTMLKSLRRSGGSRKDHLSVLELLDELNLDICGDEVLLNMVLDACIRQAKQQRLETILAAYEKSCLRPAAHTYGSLIRAYSALRRFDRCRALWAEMMDDRRMELDRIVFGCMLDALVCAGCMDEALALFNKWKGFMEVNSVIYSTLMKGFASSHLPDQAMGLFHEMRAAGIRPTTTSYNTVADALARVGKVTEVQKLVGLMSDDACQPDHVTHSIMVKAFCIAGNLDQAIQVFNKMQMNDPGFTSRPCVGARDGSITIAFNTLLDGCIKHNRSSLADRLLDQVEELGVQPTNFTLCIFLKMCGRRRQLARALRAAEQWPKRYNFSANSAVRTCLMSACFKCDSVESAFKVFRNEKTSGFPDARAYGVIITGCVRHGALDSAVQLVEEAYGLNCRSHGRVGRHPGAALDASVVEQLVNELMDKESGEGASQPILQTLRAALPVGLQPPAAK